MSPRDALTLQDYLRHIQQAIIRIEQYVSGLTRADFLANEEKQDAVIRNLEVIGEAAGKIQHHFPDFSEQHPELPLGAAYGMRNSLSHGYFQVDLLIVWNTLERDLPTLREQIEGALSGFA
jgi:uncharacterized protein with HEPN domain